MGLILMKCHTPKNKFSINLKKLTFLNFKTFVMLHFHENEAHSGIFIPFLLYQILNFSPFFLKGYLKLMTKAAAAATKST